jgi:ABC-type branched-subunit amino acid transport system substrate-binding protein
METPFLVFGPYGFTPSNVTGIMLYDGWPSTSYNTPALQQWAYEHYNRTLGTSGFNWYPFPASATFYAALQCLFDAVQQVGLNRTLIRNALANDNFTTILGNTHLHQGYGMECSAAGTICQWTGQQIPAGDGCPAGTICSVVWPLSAASAAIVYPKPAW